LEGFNWLTGFVFPYINFIIFALLAVKFFKKPASEIFKSKRLEYEKIVKDAGEAKRVAEEKNRALKVRLENLDKEIQEMRSQALASAKAQSEEIIVRAAQLAKNMEEEAKRRAEAEFLRARNHLRKEFMDTLKGTIEQMTVSDLNAEKQENLVKKKVKQLSTFSIEV
jgi:F-type H+-transporting ATPase subunit b